MKIRLFLGASFALGAVALVSPRAQAQDIFYNYNPGAGQPTNADIYQNQVNISSTVNATYEGTVGHDFGYGGLQQQGASSGTGTHVGIFSIWDQTNNGVEEDTTLVTYSPLLSIQKAGRFGGEGTGCQLLFNYNWQLNTPYRLAYRLWKESDNAHMRLSTYYYDGTSWNYAGTFRANTGGRYLGYAYAFNENYGGTYGTRSQTFNNCWWHVPATTPVWANLTSCYVTNTPMGPNDFGTTTAVNGSGFKITSNSTGPANQPSGNISYTPASTDSPLYMPYYINCGADVSDGKALSTTFEPDAYYSGTSYTNTSSSPVDVTNDYWVATSKIMQSTRYGADFTYTLGGFKPNTYYPVYLHFAETYYNAAGQRFEDVTINGTKVLSNFDIYAAAGGKNKAVVKPLSTYADSKGVITIRLQHTAGASGDPYASINAIEIYPNSNSAAGKSAAAKTASVKAS